MTEAEWQTATDPASLLAFVRDEASERKLRLFACGCCRLNWDQLTDDRSRSVVEVVERFVDGKSSEADLQLYRELAEQAHERLQAFARRALEEARGKRRHFVTEAFEFAGAAVAAYMTAWDSPYIYPYPFETDCGGGPYDVAAIGGHAYGYERIFRNRGDVARDIFGNPFRPVTIDPAWRTSDVILLANGIYAERAFDRMPILADALQDAGCDSDDILNHLRDAKTTHVRGCWALDLVLGKM